MAFNLSIISGGQAAADCAALDFAIKYQIPYGGWCPKGRLYADVPIDTRYQLKETPTEAASEAMESNVRDSDATIVFTTDPKAAGEARKILSLARKLKKPCLHLHKGILGAHQKIIAFNEKHYVRRLHIAGSIEPEENGVHEWVTTVLEKVQAELQRQETTRR